MGRLTRIGPWSALLLVAGLAGCFKDESDGGSAGDGAESSSGADGGDGGDDGDDGSADGGDDGSGSASGDGTSAGDDATTSADGGSADDGSADGTSDSTSDTGSDDCEPDAVCVDAPPVDWMGPVVVYRGATGTAPECTGDYPSLGSDGRDDLEAPNAACAQCQCGQPTGIECQGGDVRLYNTVDCGLGEGSTFALGGHDECITFTNPNGDDSVNTDAVLTVPGTGECAASGGAPTVPPFSWGTDVRLCGGGTTSGACGDGGMCMPRGSEPFGAGVCIGRDGDHSCPQGVYTQRSLAFLDATDNRGCSTCTCGSPGGASCNAVVEVHHNPSCSNLNATVTSPGAMCEQLTSTNPPLSGRVIVYSTPGGACIEGGGQPTGGVMPQNPITICCTPP